MAAAPIVTKIAGETGLEVGDRENAGINTMDFGSSLTWSEYDGKGDNVSHE